MSCRKCGGRAKGRLCRQCEIEERAEDRANARKQLDDDDDDEGEDPVPLPDGGRPTPTTDAEIDRWVELITTHADDTTLADHLGGIHEQTLREEFDVDRSTSTIRKHLKADDRVTAVLGFGDEGVRRSWAPADSDIGVGEDVACPKGHQPDDPGQPCVVCGHPYDREAHDECPQCTNGSVKDYDVVTDGGVDQPVSQAELERRAKSAGTAYLAHCGRANVDPNDLLEEIRAEMPSGDARADGGWPEGDPCIDCGEPMDVGAVGNPGETITWQECEDCGIGWGPFTGYVDTDEEPEESPLRSDGGRAVHPADAALTHRGMGDQSEPTCPNGSVECAKPGTAPCPDCFLGGGDGDA